MRARDNPFRADRVEALQFRAPGFSWDALLTRLKRQRGRGAIRGQEGSGKTTLLHELSDRLAAAGHEVRLLRPDLDDRRRASCEVRRFSSAVDERTALLLDGADRLGWLEWRRLMRAARRAQVLVVTTHREGRLPTLHRCATSPRLIGELVAELDPEMARGPELETLMRRCDGNARVMFRELYDRAASRSWRSSGATLPI